LALPPPPLSALCAAIFFWARAASTASKPRPPAARKAGAPQALFHALDVAKTASVETFVQWARTWTSAVDVLINNAGGAQDLAPVATGRDEDWETMLQTNVLGVLRVTRAVLPMIPKDAGSSILNIGSVAGRFAYEGGAVYCAAKAGELKITQALRLELNGTGIRVGTIDPGLARTEFGAGPLQRRPGPRG
jgi:3-hydroxy acid dehydrogenase / malonic semialdehyde reductase